MTQKKLAREIVNTLLYYYAHYSNGDGEGMDIALRNLMDVLEEHMPELAKLRKKQSKIFDRGLKCPTCKDWTWQHLELSEDGNFIIVTGDEGCNCEHEWRIEI